MRHERMPTQPQRTVADLWWITLGLLIAGLCVGITLWQILVLNP